MCFKRGYVAGLGVWAIIFVFVIIHHGPIAEGRSRINVRLPKPAGDYLLIRYLTFLRTLKDGYKVK